MRDSKMKAFLFGECFVGGKSKKIIERISLKMIHI